MSGVAVDPVELAADPVDGDALEAHAVVFDDGLSVARAVDRRPVDGLGVDVGKVDALLALVKVDGHHVAQVVLVHHGVLSGVDGHVAHVVLVGEDQPRPHAVAPLASPAVQLPSATSPTTERSTKHKTQ